MEQVSFEVIMEKCTTTMTQCDLQCVRSRDHLQEGVRLTDTTTLTTYLEKIEEGASMEQQSLLRGQQHYSGRASWDRCLPGEKLIMECCQPLLR